MTIAEIRPGSPSQPVKSESLFSPESLIEKLYVTPNGKGIDLTTSPFPRVEHVARHERASLDFVASDPEMNKGVKIWVGSNTINKFTSHVVFKKIRRPDEMGIGDNGIVIVEDKTSDGEVFANEARTKIELLPRFNEILMDNSHLFISSVKVWFVGDEIYDKIPWRLVVQPTSQMDLVFLTPYPDNEEILRKIGKGEFRSVTHRLVNIPQLAAKAA